MSSALGLACGCSIPSVIWLQPKLVVEIEYRAWTGDRKLRYASCKGLREVQDNATVYELD
ncbi:hypothetical protein ELH88_35215 [Rhizobium ruizarguesonis]|nr:hypothetical protein ELH87_36110 [Rhizobium ruizarguesonis]TAY42240.1 hypothetical protein ELH88_35215 [Rhizobium ruizarguesonis]